MTDPSPAAGGITHQRGDGAVHMVDVSEKPVTSRRALAAAAVVTRPDVIALIVDGGLPKGEALATARIAGIMGAKKTPELIPLCHPLSISGVEVDLATHGDRIEIRATVSTRAATGGYADTTGPEIVAWLAARGFETAARIVADGPGVETALRAAADAGLDLVVTTGGTGITRATTRPRRRAP